MKRVTWLLLLMMSAVLACRKEEASIDPAPTSTDTASSTAAVTPTNTDTGGPGAVPAGDLEFATTASMANLYEIVSGKLAVDRTVGAEYKQFAETMVRQHTEIGESYKPIAEAQNLPMPTELSGNFKTLYDALEATPKGPAFDKLYRQQMIDTHNAAVSLFEKESTSGQDPRLKEFAARWLPVIADHREMSQMLPEVK